VILWAGLHPAIGGALVEIDSPVIAAVQLSIFSPCRTTPRRFLPNYQIVNSNQLRQSASYGACVYPFQALVVSDAAQRSLNCGKLYCNIIASSSLHLSSTPVHARFRAHVATSALDLATVCHNLDNWSPSERDALEHAPVPLTIRV